MGFTESLRTCFGKYAMFDGRASRPEFWYFFLFAFGYMFIAGFLLGLVGTSDATIDVAIIVLMIPILFHQSQSQLDVCMILTNQGGCSVFLFLVLWQMNFWELVM